MKNNTTFSSLGISISIVLLSVVMSAATFAQTRSSFADSRDGKTYHYVKVGGLFWMTDNLRYNVPANSWAYNNDSINQANFGLLYNFKAVQTACPKGWHVPAEKEWGALALALGGLTEAGAKMQAMDTIAKGKDQPNSSALSSLLGGIRHPDGNCIGLNLWGGCWTSTKVNDTTAKNVLFAHGAKDISVSTNDVKSGLSIRCVKK